MLVIQYKQRGSTIGQIKKYLQSLYPGPDDSDPIKRKKIRLLANIHAKVEYIRSLGAIARPPHSKPLRGFAFHEMLLGKDSRTLLRILFFRHEDKMVLLYSFEKPRSYAGTKEEKLVQKEYENAKAYYEDFLRNPTSFEQYELPYIPL